MSNTEDHGEKTVYELGYLVLPSVPEESVPQVVSNLVSIIEKAGGKILEGENPFLDKLAYSMSKVVGARKYVVDEAYIGWTKFEAEPASAQVIKSETEKVEEILRFLLIKVPRETNFTFEKARKEKQEKENPASASEEVVVEEAPKEVVE